MSAGAGHDGFDAARGQPLRGDIIDRCTVNSDYGAQPRFISFYERANAAKIPFPFFSHVAGENYRHAGADVAFLERARNGYECGEACAVVGDARGFQAGTIALDANVRARGKNGVEVCGEENYVVGVRSDALADHVADGIDVRL